MYLNDCSLCCCYINLTIESKHHYYQVNKVKSPPPAPSSSLDGTFVVGGLNGCVPIFFVNFHSQNSDTSASRHICMIRQPMQSRYTWNYQAAT